MNCQKVGGLNSSGKKQKEYYRLKLYTEKGYNRTFK